jgi:hypothetical protein
MIQLRLFKIIIFLLLLFVADRIGGYALNSLFIKSREYNSMKLRYTLNQSKPDVIFLGSSRALNQFDPLIFERKTGLTTYNYGFAGQGLMFSYIQLHETLKRHTPKIVILDISPNIMLDIESQSKLKILLPYIAQDNIIRTALTKNNKFEEIKLLSKIYPLNSSALTSVMGYFHTFNDTLKGFIPVYGNVDTIFTKTEVNRMFQVSNIPDEKFIPLQNIISLCQLHKIRLAIVLSPVYNTNTNLLSMINQIKDFCKATDYVLIFDFTNYKNITSRSELFKDNLHLNFKGAELFTTKLADSIAKKID